MYVPIHREAMVIPSRFWKCSLVNGFQPILKTVHTDEVRTKANRFALFHVLLVDLLVLSLSPSHPQDPEAAEAAGPVCIGNCGQWSQEDWADNGLVDSKGRDSYTDQNIKLDHDVCQNNGCQ
jgi:hypothetical protein